MDRGTLLATLSDAKRRKEEFANERTRANADAIRADCRTLAGFIKHAWKVLEPRAKLVWNWHLDAICEHLTAVTEGRINRLLINVPPGSSKSLIVSVLWPAWEWTLPGMASMRYLSTSFNDGPAKRDTRKHRDLVQSGWYQTLWPEIALVRAGETSFANTSTGNRECSAFGSLTSQRGDRLIIDDPHSTETAESDADREKTTRKFREGALDRLNDLEKSAIVVIMQRLHEEDLSGVIFSLPELGFCTLVIPMRFDKKLAALRCPTAIGWTDPRQFEGELMDPIRFPAKECDKLEIGKGAYAWAGQYQQQPAPRGGAIFKADWWKFYNPVALPVVKRIIQSWDTAFKAKEENDPSSLTVWAECETGYYLIHRENQRMEYPLLKQYVISFGNKLFGGQKASAILVEDKASGQSLIQDLRQTSLPIIPIKVDTDKISRAHATTGIVQSGRVYLPEGAQWLPAYTHEMQTFPRGAHDDDVDSTTQALTYMNQGAGDGMGFLDFYRAEMAKG